MNPVITMAAKDLRLLIRDRMGLFFIAIFPVIYGIFFGAMFGNVGEAGSASLSVAVADEDQSDASRQFAKALEKTGSVKVTPAERNAASTMVRKGEQVAFIAIPKGFGEHAGTFWGGSSSKLDLGIDPARKAESGFLNGLIMQAMFERMKDQFMNPAAMKSQVEKARADIDKSKELSTSQRLVLKTFMGSLDQFLGSVDTKVYNQGPQMEPAQINTIDVTVPKGPVDELVQKKVSAFEISFPSAMLWGVMGSLAGFAGSLVKERSDGTYLRLKTAPISRAQILGGKAAACFASSVGVLAFMLLLGHFAFNVRLSNPVGLLAAMICISACFTGLMLVVSVIGKTEAAVRGATWAVLTVMAMIGGGMIPLIFMPSFMQALSSISPVKWSVLALEGAIWRGFGFTEMLKPCGILLGIGAVGFAAGTALLTRSDS